MLDRLDWTRPRQTSFLPGREEWTRMRPPRPFVLKGMFFRTVVSWLDGCNTVAASTSAADWYIAAQMMSTPKRRGSGSIIGILLRWRFIEVPFANGCRSV